MLGGPRQAWDGRGAQTLAVNSTEGCPNGPTEAVNPLIEKVKRREHGFRNLANYRLQLLLHYGVTWQTPRRQDLRAHAPRLMA